MEPSPTSQSATAKLKVNGNFRSGPGTSYDIYRQLTAGTAVQIIAVAGEGDAIWYKTVIDGQEGWLSAVVLDVAQDTVANLPTDAADSQTATPLPENSSIPLEPTLLPRSDIPVMAGLRLRTARIYQTELGDDWPLSVETGTLGCDGDNGVGAVIFALDNGETYALNGVAKGRTNLSGKDIYLV